MMLFPSFTSDCHTFSLFLVQSFLPLSLSLPLYLSLSLFVALVSRSSHFPSCVQMRGPLSARLRLSLLPPRSYGRHDCGGGLVVVVVVVVVCVCGGVV